VVFVVFRSLREDGNPSRHRSEVGAVGFGSSKFQQQVSWFSDVKKLPEHWEDWNNTKEVVMALVPTLVALSGCSKPGIGKLPCQ
jgi:hypothetical protein